MFRAIGVILILWYLSQVFSQSFVAADSAGKATFNALQAAAIKAEQNFE